MGCLAAGACLTKEGKKVLMVNVMNQPQYMLENIDIIPDLVPKEQLFEAFDEAVEWVKNDIN